MANVERLGGQWPFSFPHEMSVKDLTAGDLFLLIRRGVAEGQYDAQQIQRVRRPGMDRADSIAAGLKDSQGLLAG